MVFKKPCIDLFNPYFYITVRTINRHVSAGLSIQFVPVRFVLRQSLSLTHFHKKLNILFDSAFYLLHVNILQTHGHYSVYDYL